MKKTEMQLRKEALVAGMVNAGYSLVQAQERLASLPEGIYPCRVLGAIAIVTAPDGTVRSFNSHDAFRLSADKQTIEVTLNEYAKDSKFAEPTDQVGIMFEVVSGKFGTSNAHIPMRFNLNGYKRREDYADTEWLASGLEEVEGYAAQLGADNTYSRIVSDDRKKTGQSILATALGAIFGEFKNEDDAPYDQLDLQLIVEDGADCFANVVLKKDLKDTSERVIPMFVNKFDIDKCTHKNEKVAVAEVAALPQD
jgi:hypothetical protein